MIVLARKLIPTIALCDAAEPRQLGFQDAATPMMQGIIDLHHDIFFFLIIILVFVIWILARALWHYKTLFIPVHGTTIEILWTIFPSIILMFITIPSFALLYSMDGVVDPAKAVEYQFYGTYEYSDYNSSDEESLTFDSYMISEEDLDLGQLRLLEVDNRVVVPANSHVRMIVTSADVLHSWAVPSLGVKCDAVPGRLNQISTNLISTLSSLFSPALAHCEGRGILEVPRAFPVPEPAPPPFIPTYPNTLMDVLDQRREIYSSLSIHFLGQTDWVAFSRLFDMVETQYQIEIRIEAALRHAGLDPDIIVRERGNIRDCLFYRGRSHHRISAPTLRGYLVDIGRRGTYHSVPYLKLMRAVRRGDVFL